MRDGIAKICKTLIPNFAVHRHIPEMQILTISALFTVLIKQNVHIFTKASRGKCFHVGSSLLTKYVCVIFEKIYLGEKMLTMF